MRLSSKMLNITQLDALIQVFKKTEYMFLFLTAYGYIIADLANPIELDLSENYDMLELIEKATIEKVNFSRLIPYMKKLEIKNSDIELIGDGALLELENVTICNEIVSNNNNKAFKTDSFMLHTSDVIGFSLFLRADMDKL